MNIIEIKSLEIPDIKIVRFERFLDKRGYFTEQYRKSDMIANPKIPSLNKINFFQANESYSLKGTIRGLHFQWDPPMGKLVRIISGKMIDLVLDIRKNSHTYGKIIGYEMTGSKKKNYDEWIWVPPGFAHGFCFSQNSLIEYFCSGEYNKLCESGISPLSKDLDWSLCNKQVRERFENITTNKVLITNKDLNAQSFLDFKQHKMSNEFYFK